MVLMWSERRRPIVLYAANAVPGLLLWWISLVAVGDLDLGRNGALDVLFFSLRMFGLLWAVIGSALVVRLVFQVARASPPPPRKTVPGAGQPGKLTRYEWLMLLATASGGVATVAAVFIGAALK
jgi:hypothetical protein